MTNNNFNIESFCFKIDQKKVQTKKILGLTNQNWIKQDHITRKVNTVSINCLHCFFFVFFFLLYRAVVENMYFLGSIAALHSLVAWYLRMAEPVKVAWPSMHRSFAAVSSVLMARTVEVYNLLWTRLYRSFVKVENNTHRYATCDDAIQVLFQRNCFSIGWNLLN